MKKIGSKFYCIQPIHIEVDSLSKLFNAQLNIKSINDNAIIDANNHPKWKKTLDELYNLYSSIVVLDCQNLFDVNVLKSELNHNKFYVNAKTDISKYVNTENTNIYLLFDYRLFQFIIVYEIGFTIPINALDEIAITVENQLDFYNSVRNIFVKETDDSLVLPHILSLKTNILKFIKNYISSNFLFDIPLNDLKILNNSGNITNVVTMEKLDSNECEKYSKLFIKLNSFSERIPNGNLPIHLDQIHKNDLVEIDYTKELYYFNGRFHTITLHSKKNEYRYIPIQFQMQYLWFYLAKQINIVLEKYNDDILSDDSATRVNDYSDKVDLIINRVELLNIYNQKFKLSIESDIYIYSTIESRWSIEEMIKASNQHIKFFKDHLTRIFNKKVTKAEQRQNKILVFISVFQFISLFSIWDSYLSLIEKDSSSAAEKIIPLFGSLDRFQTFNMYLPLMFILLTIIMIIYIFPKKE